MRKLLVTRGLPGSGKTHTLQALGLSDFTLGADTLRLLMASPILSSQGRMTISPEHDNRVWKMIMDTLALRMSRGETIVVDATHPTAKTFEPYLLLAHEHRYSVACLDFSEVPADVVHWFNDGRQDYRKVPDSVIARIAESTAKGSVPLSVERFMVRSDKSHIPGIQDWLGVPTIDLNSYSRVVHVGDIQGCYTATMAALDGGLRSDTFYVFVGDACDRGDENGLVMRWLIDKVIDQPNVCFLWGNHEDHLHRQALGMPPVSQEFAQNTLPQLHAAGVSEQELDHFCSRLENILLYRFGSQSVMVTHAGLSTVPDNPWMISARQCTYGTGHYEDDVDTQFNTHGPKNWVQVHGHRNHHLCAVQATERSFNLESSVEHGGHMRALVLDKTGFHPLEVANPVFRPFRLRKHRKMTVVPSWMTQGSGDTTLMSAELRKAMNEHPEVRERASQAFPNVVSLNFSRKVFFNSSWDSVTVKARGLFLNKETGSIVARFADKFWNIGEKPEVSMEALREKLVFPITAWNKENGFLGLLGYDSESDKLFASSKSTTEGDFAGWFREILDETIPSPGKRDALKRFLRDTESCMAFEVIDPVRDPHMIEYPERKLVLLDVVHRSTDFARLTYCQLEQVGKDFGLEIKKKGVTLENLKSFEGWRHQVMSNTSRKIEGWVIEDATGFQVKDKTPFYSFWKLARGMKDAIIREREGGKIANGLNADFLDYRGIGFLAPLATEFKDWCDSQTTQTLKSDIISLRKAFETAPQPVNAPGM